jgi:hypothetical protein
LNFQKNPLGDERKAPSATPKKLRAELEEKLSYEFSLKKSWVLAIINFSWYDLESFSD